MYASSVRFAIVSSPAYLVAAAFLLGTLLAVAAARTSPVMGLIIGVGVLVTVAAFVFPDFALLLTVAVIPLERIGRLTPDSSEYTMSFMRIVGVIALGSFLLHAMLHKWKLKFGSAFLLYFLFCAWAITTVFFTSDQLGGVRAASAILGNLLFFFLIVNMVRNWRMARYAVAVWLIASVAIGIYTVYEWHAGSYRVAEQARGLTSSRFLTVLKDKSEWADLSEVDRALGTSSSPAVYAINMILTVPFLLYFFRSARGWLWKAAALLACLIVVYNVLLTNTRAATIVVAGVVVLCFLRKLVKVRPKAILAAALFVLVLLLSSPGAVYKRVLDLANYTYSRSGTLQVRMEYWKAGAKIIEEHWLTGVGFGNQLVVPALANVEGPDHSTVHNEYLETMIETGIFGWLVFFGFVAYLLYMSFAGAGLVRRRDPERYWFLVACQIAMISVLVYAVQVDVFHFPLKGWWLVAGLTWAAHEFNRKEVLQTAVAS
ncbi:MAG: O-antigen ligase family protein [Candidatus Acidiferrum sp.]